jgi:hypothetical protein
MKVLILGTGSTIGTLWNVAHGAELGVYGFTKRLSRVKRRWRDDYAALARVVADCGSENLDQIWTHLDYTIKFQRSLGGNPYVPGTSGELHRALLDAYSLTDEVAKLDLQSDFTLKTELMRLADGDVLVSFNWDTTAERIGADLGMRLRVAGPNLDGLAERAVNLVKPHGSLSWEDGGTPGSVKRDDLGRPRLTPMRVEAVHPLGRGHMQPLVLGTVAMKEQLIEGTQAANPKIYEVFADQWAAVVQAIASATALTVIGYSFPSEDTYGRFLLGEAAKRRTTPLPRIEYYAAKKDQKVVKQALRDVFGEVRCDFMGRACPAAARRAPPHPRDSHCLPKILPLVRRLLCRWFHGPQ